VCDLSWSCFCPSRCPGLCLLVVVIGRPSAPIPNSPSITGYRSPRAQAVCCWKPLSPTCIHMSRHLPPCGLARQTLAGYPAEVCMVIERCTHNQPPTWNTASGLELCVSKYTISVSDTRCLRILAASNTEQQPGITRSGGLLLHRLHTIPMVRVLVQLAWVLGRWSLAI
jgi:hypothetical protein